MLRALWPQLLKHVAVGPINSETKLYPTLDTRIKWKCFDISVVLSYLSVIIALKGQSFWNLIVQYQ